MSTHKTSSSKESIIKNSFFPKEEMLEVMRNSKKLIIGVPKEQEENEFRVPLTPEAVENLVSDGHTVYIEQGAGLNSNYSDLEYSEKGGTVTPDKKTVLSCDIILKVAPLTDEETTLLKGNQIIISSLYINNQKEKYFNTLMNKRVTAISFEKIRDKSGEYPILESMSTISGIMSVIIAGQLLTNTNKGKGVMIGGMAGITPTDVVIMGAGTAGEYAIRAATGLGATIKVFDDSVSRLRNLERIFGRSLHTSIFHPKVLSKSLASADVVIGAYYSEHNNPYVITEDMVKNMKPGSVIVDLLCNEGTCIETSECRSFDSPTFTKHKVIHYCVPNIASCVARTASIALSNVLSPIIYTLAEPGGLKYQLTINYGLRNGVYIYNGILTNEQIGTMFDLPSKDIDLLMAAF